MSNPSVEVESIEPRPQPKAEKPQTLVYIGQDREAANEAAATVKQEEQECSSFVESSTSDDDSITLSRSNNKCNSLEEPNSSNNDNMDLSNNNDSDCLQIYQLNWHNYNENLVSNFNEFISKKLFIDCHILVENDVVLEAHRIVLAANSRYFARLIENHLPPNPFDICWFVLPEVKAEEMEIILGYMYSGEMTVNETEFHGIMALAHKLEVCGITNSSHGHGSAEESDDEDVSVPGTPTEMETSIDEEYTETEATTPTTTSATTPTTSVSPTSSASTHSSVTSELHNNNPTSEL